MPARWKRSWSTLNRFVRTTAEIYSHAIRGKGHAAAQCWDDIMQRPGSETEKPKL